MTRIIFIGALLGGLGLSGACGSSEQSQSTGPTCVAPTEPGCSIAVNDQVSSATATITATSPIKIRLPGG